MGEARCRLVYCVFSPVLPSLHFVARNVPEPQYSESGSQPGPGRDSWNKVGEPLAAVIISGCPPPPSLQAHWNQAGAIHKRETRDGECAMAYPSWNNVATR